MGGKEKIRAGLKFSPILSAVAAPLLIGAPRGATLTMTCAVRRRPLIDHKHDPD